MKRIGIVGRGNVGTHLERALGSKGWEVTSVNSRNLEGMKGDEDVLIISVSDDALSRVCGRIKETFPGFKGIVAHTAGSVDAAVLSPYFASYGVFYPLQAFSKKDSSIDFSLIPIFVESPDEEVLNTLEKLADSLTTEVYVLSSADRKRLHIASVFACNFSNALYSIANDLLKESNLPFTVLLPLIRQTVRKLDTLSPAQAQTGPAVRGDKKIISNHLEALSAESMEKEIYELISNYIMKKNEQNRI